MAKVIQLAKDLLKGGNKEDIYPKTTASAVFVNDYSGSQTTLDQIIKGTLVVGISGSFPDSPQYTDPDINFTDIYEAFNKGWDIILEWSITNHYSNTNGTRTFRLIEVTRVAKDITFKFMCNSFLKENDNIYILTVSTTGLSVDTYPILSPLYTTLDVNGNITEGATVSEIISNVTNKRRPINLSAILSLPIDNNSTVYYQFTLESFKTISNVSTVVFSCIHKGGSSLVRTTATASTNDTKFTISSESI